MKRCPECRRDYYDETLLYCLDDGNALPEDPATLDADEPATAILSGSELPSESRTRPQITTTDETAVLPSGITDLPKLGFDKPSSLLHSFWRLSYCRMFQAKL